MSDLPPITFSPALPCSSVIGDRRCGRDATVGTLYPMGGGQYILQPFCKTCVQALQKVYAPPAGDAPDAPDIARRFNDP